MFEVDLALDEEVLSKLKRSQFVVYTDLDGTLLGHHQYELGAVPDLLTLLRKRDVPVIFNTSKTFAEVRRLQERLSYFSPCIVENGGGIHQPLEGSQERQKGAVTRAALIEFLQGVSQYRFEKMSDWSAQTLARVTGLDLESAVLANERLYTEPLLWLDSKDRLREFQKEVQASGFACVKGGRFVHMMGVHDKGTAMKAMQEHLRGADTLVSIAFGDNDNDRPMLEAADIAVVLTLPERDSMRIDNTCVLYPPSMAPMGWVEAMTYILSLTE